jgi:hypothetical protein
MALSLLSEFREFPFRSLADGMLLHKYNHDHPTDSRGAIPGKGFSDLPGRPFGGRMLRHVDVNRVSPLMTQRNNTNSKRKFKVLTIRKSIATIC